MSILARSTAAAALFLALSAGAAAQDDFISHVVFRNSAAPGDDFYTEARDAAPSTLEASEGRLPVDTAHFLSPPNALRLHWQSVSGGSWAAEIRAVDIDNRPAAFLGSVLSLWVYAPEAIEAKDLPRVQLTDTQWNFSVPVSLAEFAGRIPAAQWVQVRIPLESFASGSVRSFDAHRLRTVLFSQGDADNQPHTLLVDEIQISNNLAAAPSGSPSNLSAPGGLKARGYERHVDLEWNAEAVPSPEYYLIYRSLDGGAFLPVGIQEPGTNRYTDFVGKPGVKAAYKVSAVDRQYRESGASETVNASTHEMSDDELLTMTEEACFRYYWELGSHPVAGMALENFPGDRRLVATGASGFGIMAIVVGMERGFITREQGVERLNRITEFLERADRFHGAWAHFMDGDTGKALPLFGIYDNGGDIVETAFLVQGLLTARQYLNRPTEEEKRVVARITRLWETVEWDWYAKNTEDGAILWHWSPQWSFLMHHRLTGFNETMIVYLLGIGSPTHGIPASYYYTGWASQSEEAAKYRAGWSRAKTGTRYGNGSTFEGIKLDVGVGEGGPLFFTQYSFMGPDPHQLTDSFTNYFRNNRNLALINYRYCVRNPGKYKGYGPAWGLTASLDPDGYAVHDPNIAHDNGTISPTAALGAFPYTPVESLAALKYFYREIGDRAWGIYGPVDAFNLSQNWVSPSYLGLDQAPITVMIENSRSGLIWKTFMSNREMARVPGAIRHGPAQAADATGKTQ